MAAGTLYGTVYKQNGAANGVYSLWLSWNSWSSGLTSTVNATLYLKRNDGYANSAWNRYHQVWGRIYCDGGEVGAYNNLDVDTRHSNTVTLCSTTFSVQHQNGVEKRINLSASFGNVAVSSCDHGDIGSTQVSLGTITIYSPCGAPASVSLSPNPFEDNVTLSWSGAGGGANNSISSYFIQHSISSDNSSWSGWIDTTTISTNSSSGSNQFTPSISRGSYIKYRIRTQGTAGGSYYSDFRESNSVRRIPYTNCTAPTVFNVNPNPFESTINISWDGASSGTNNSITGYTLEYSTSSDNASWGNWSQFENISSTDTNGNTTFAGATINRGNYIKFRIKALGTAGEIYYSPYKESKVIRRNSLPNPPNNFSVSVSSYVIGERINLSWTESIDIDSNISHYKIEYCTSVNRDTWSEWMQLTSTTELMYSFIPKPSFLANQSYVKFRVCTEDNLGASSSDYKESIPVQRDDNTGVRFGINGQYAKAYLYVGKNGSWVEHDVAVGIGGNWVEV